MTRRGKGGRYVLRSAVIVVSLMFSAPAAAADPNIVEGGRYSLPIVEVLPGGGCVAMQRVPIETTPTTTINHLITATFSRKTQFIGQRTKEKEKRNLKQDFWGREVWWLVPGRKAV